jgi:hypothetical protein
MQTASAKAKGRNGQQEVIRQIMDRMTQFSLTDDDLTSRPMGSSGDDIITSPRALKKLYFRPWEVKRRKKIALVRWIDQSLRSLGKKKVTEPHPIVCFREDHGEWYCSLKLGDLLMLLENYEPN